MICSNSEDADHLAGRGVQRDRLTRHHSGVEPEFLAASGDLPPAIERRGLLFLGSWLNRKGVLDLVPATADALRRHPQEHLTIAGCHAGPDQFLPEFPEDVRGRVRINSRVDGNSALLEIYRRHSVFVLPSYFEGQPLVTIEAAALGMPIVTTHVCGMRDFIEPGKNGLTAPVADPAALAKALNHLLDSPEEARHFGLRALKLG